MSYGMILFDIMAQLSVFITIIEINTNGFFIESHVLNKKQSACCELYPKCCKQLNKFKGALRNSRFLHCHDYVHLHNCHELLNSNNVSNRKRYKMSIFKPALLHHPHWSEKNNLSKHSDKLNVINNITSNGSDGLKKDPNLNYTALDSSLPVVTKNQIIPNESKNYEIQDPVTGRTKLDWKINCDTVTDPEPKLISRSPTVHCCRRCSLAWATAEPVVSGIITKKSSGIRTKSEIQFSNNTNVGDVMSTTEFYQYLYSPTTENTDCTMNIGVSTTERNLVSNLSEVKGFKKIKVSGSSVFDYFGIQYYNKNFSIKDYISYVSERTAYINNRNMLAQWDYAVNRTNKNYKTAMISSLELTHYQKALKKFLLPLKKEKVNDTMVEREIKLLLMPSLSIMPDIKIAVFEEVLFEMDTIFNSATVNKWTDPKMHYHLPEILKAVASSHIPDELQYYWTEWRNVTGKKLKHLFEQYVELMNLTATNNGFNDAAEMWIREYETEDFMQLIACHWEEVRPLYIELYTYVRGKLHKYYGDVALSSENNCPIPAHLTGDLWGQSWINVYNITKPFKHISDYSQIDLESMGLTTTKLALIAEKFFSSLGFQSLPESFWKQSVLTKQGADMSCEPSAWDMNDSKDFRIKMCSNGTLQDLFDIHRELAHIQYFIQYKNLSFPFRSGPNPAFHEAIAGALVLSIKNPIHLKNAGLLPSHGGTSEMSINFLMGQALEKIAFLPFSYIVDLWRYKIFKGDIKSNEYNQKWWELRMQYQGLVPPVPRSDEDLDPACKWHIATNKPYLQNFLSTIMEFQFYEALCRQSGFVGSSLHNCDFQGNLWIGNHLRNIMRLGSTQHWRVTMKLLTGTRQISTRGLLEYFKPLHKWLKTENTKSGEKMGWSNTVL